MMRSAKAALCACSIEQKSAGHNFRSAIGPPSWKIFPHPLTVLHIGGLVAIPLTACSSPEHVVLARRILRLGLSWQFILKGANAAFKRSADFYREAPRDVQGTFRKWGGRGYVSGRENALPCS